MKRIVLSLCLLVLLAGAACAQSLGNVNLPKSCTFGFGTDANGLPTACLAAPSAGTVTTGCGIVGNGTAASPITLNVGLKTISAGRPIASGDNCQQYAYDSTTAGSFALAAAGSTGFVWPFAFCITVVNAGGIAFTGQTIRGGPSSYAKNQNVCLGVSDQTPATWEVINWTALATPNAAALP